MSYFIKKNIYQNMWLEEKGRVGDDLTLPTAKRLLAKSRVTSFFVSNLINSKVKTILRRKLREKNQDLLVLTE
jgi:hypothetical protein